MRSEHSRFAASRAKTSTLIGAVLVCCLLARPVAAEPPAAVSSNRGLPPSYLWLSASAALITASLGGLYALKVRSIYEQAQLLPAVSPMRGPLQRDAERTELTADALFAGAALLALGSVCVSLLTDWRSLPPPPEHARATGLHVTLVPVASRQGATLLLRGALP